MLELVAWLLLVIIWLFFPSIILSGRNAKNKFFDICFGLSIAIRFLAPFIIIFLLFGGGFYGLFVFAVAGPGHTFLLGILGLDVIFMILMIIFSEKTKNKN